MATAAAALQLAFLFCFPLTLSLGFLPDSSSNPRLLVLLDDPLLKSSHSTFFSSLADRGYVLDFKLATDPFLSLKRYGEFLYDGLIIFAPSVEKFGGSIDSSSIMDFIDSGHDLILAADVTTSDLIREIAAECGADFEEDPEAIVLDHLNFALIKTETVHSLIAANSFTKSSAILGEKGIEGPVLFRGIAHSTSPVNSLVTKVLTASPSAYSANPNAKLKEPPVLTGNFIGLVSVVQARNNARVLISGSLEMFSNKLFLSPVTKFGSTTRYEKSGNEQFAAELSKWTFHERGHLKAMNVHHHKIGETEEPAMYRITDHLEYSLEIFEWTGKEWKPYLADDVLVQFYMMGPYVLKTMRHNGKGLYSTSFQVPDVYGVFQFKVEYRHLGYTTLSLSKQIPVRPFRHNEYDRFIQAAYPYYSACFSMMFGFFVFGLVFLHHK